MDKAVIILPTYNERENISSLIDKLEQEFKNISTHDMSILVVDDNSPDGTQNLVRAAQKKYQNLYLLTGEKQGLGRAYIRGMDYAVSHLKANVVFEMDADFSHSPKKVSRLLKEIVKGADIAIGARYIKGGSIPGNWGLHRKLLSKVGNTLVKIILMRFDVHDWTSGFRAIKVSVYKKIRPQISAFTGYTFQVAFLHQSLLKKYTISEVPIHFIDRRYGKSKIGPEYVKNLLVYLIRQTIKHPPHFFKFLIVGGFGFIIQFITFRLFRGFNLRPSTATSLSAELAIISNFIWNNLWTFKDRQITQAGKLIYKFIQFNVASLGSIIIQFIVSELGTRLIGIKPFISLLGFSLFTDDIYLIVGILIGLIWNFAMYSLLIWKKHPGSGIH